MWPSSPLLSHTSYYTFPSLTLHLFLYPLPTILLCYLVFGQIEDWYGRLELLSRFCRFEEGEWWMPDL